MKLYTEEQVSKIIFKTKQWSNLSEDWLMASVTPIELPSDDYKKDLEILQNEVNSLTKKVDKLLDQNI